MCIWTIDTFSFNSSETRYPFDYSLAFSPDGKWNQQYYAVHFLRISGQLFMNMQSVRADHYDPVLQRVKCEFIPGHSLVKLDIKNDTLLYSILDVDFLARQAREGKAMIAGTDAQDDDCHLTASTMQLRRFILTYMNDRRIFPPYNKCYRMQ